MQQNRFLRRMLALGAAAGVALFAACSDDSTGPDIAERLVVVVNSVDNTLSLIPRDGDANVTVRTVSLAAQGTPVDLAVRGATAVVPLGTYPFAAVVDLRTATVARTVALPANSGATGVAFLNDTLALVANPNLNTVSPINPATGAVRAQIAVGRFPQAIVASQIRAYVLNSNLVNFTPAGPGSVTVLDGNLAVTKTIPLTGVNPAAGVIVGNRLYVLNSGNFGSASGSLSVIDLVTLTEIQHVTGFGSFPTTLAAGPGPILYVGGYGLGVFAYDPSSGTFPIPLANAIKPNGSTAIADIDIDNAGRLHVADQGACSDKGTLYRLTTPTSVDRVIRTGTCPVGFAFADIPE
jgi:hypothetical protein